MKHKFKYLTLTIKFETKFEIYFSATFNNTLNAFD